MKTNVYINVGITGHRHIAPECMAAVHLALREVLGQVRVAAESIRSRYPRFFASMSIDTEFRYRLITSLAEGADCMAAEEALAQGYELQCPLPFNRARYEATFDGGEAAVERFRDLLSHADAVMTLDFEQQDSSSSYRNASHIMLAHSDILIALWNGKPSKSIAGTYATIREAERAHLPIIIINSENPEDIVYHLDSEERRDLSVVLQERFSHILLPLGTMSDATVQQLGIPFPPEECGTDRKRMRPLSALLDKVLLWKRKVAAYSVMNSAVEDTSDREDVEKVRSFSLRRWGEMKKLYSNLSAHYSAIYRNRLFMRQLLPVVALLLLIGALNTSDAMQAILFVAQISVLLVVIVLVHIDRHSSVNRLFYGYRGMAESCRISMFLWSMGYANVNNRHRSYMQGNVRSERSWYYRHILRRIGLPSVNVECDYVRAWLLWLRRDYLQSQLQYHCTRRECSLVLQRRLRLFALFCFFGGLCATVARACVMTLDGGDVMIKVVSALALFLPTVATFWSAYSINSGFAVHYTASSGMFGELSALLSDTDTLLKSYTCQNSERVLSNTGMESLLILCDRLDTSCMEEVSDWEESIQSRMLKLV